jgi:hypothetical protein
MMKLNFGRIVEKPEEIRDEDLQKFIHEQPLIFSQRGAAVGEKYGESEVGKAIGCRMGKGASVEIKLVLELHTVAVEIAKRLQKAFMEYIEGTIEVAKKGE